MVHVFRSLYNLNAFKANSYYSLTVLIPQNHFGFGAPKEILQPNMFMSTLSDHIVHTSLNL